LGTSADRPVTKTAEANVAWHEAIGELIDDGEGDDLPARLVRALNCLLPLELAAIFVYRGRSRPLIIYDNFELAGAKKGIAAYVENTYVLNPFYQARQRGLADGVYRIRDLAPDAYFESEYYKTHRILPRDSEEIGYITEHWPEGLEEIDIAITLEPGVVAEFSVYRALSARGFSEDDLAQLRAVLPVIGALLRRYWAAHGAAGSRASPPDSRVDQAFADFGRSVLSDREREVIQLILRGHSSESIGFNLAISLGTVKTHRRNAYSKLAISSQSELLSMFLKSFQGP
jgi:DNA-binding CsgD family transcriptional regulator